MADDKRESWDHGAGDSTAVLYSYQILIIRAMAERLSSAEPRPQGMARAAKDGEHKAVDMVRNDGRTPEGARLSDFFSTRFGPARRVVTIDDFLHFDIG